MQERIELVEKVIARVFNVSEDFKKTKARNRRLVNPKKVLCSVLYNKEEMTFEQIAEYMEYTNHTTVLFHVKSMEGIYESDPRFKNKVDFVYETIHPMYIIRL